VILILLLFLQIADLPPSAPVERSFSAEELILTSQAATSSQMPHLISCAYAENERQTVITTVVHILLCFGLANVTVTVTRALVKRDRL
jgi:hypothetical protein